MTDNRKRSVSERIDDAFAVGFCIGLLVMAVIAFGASFPFYNFVDGRAVQRAEQAERRRYEQEAAEQGFGEYALDQSTGLIEFRWGSRDLADPSPEEGQPQTGGTE